MSTYQEVSRSFPAPASTGAVFKMLATEVIVMAQALLNPRKIIREVEQFRALCQQADRLESSDPAAAAALRRQAARVGMG